MGAGVSWVIAGLMLTLSPYFSCLIFETRGFLAGSLLVGSSLCYI